MSADARAKASEFSAIAAEPPAMPSVENLHFFGAPPPRACGRARAKRGRSYTPVTVEFSPCAARVCPQGRDDGRDSAKELLAQLPRFGYAPSVLRGAGKHPGCLPGRPPTPAATPPRSPSAAHELVGGAHLTTEPAEGDERGKGMDLLRDRTARPKGRARQAQRPSRGRQ